MFTLSVNQAYPDYGGATVAQLPPATGAPIARFACPASPLNLEEEIELVAGVSGQMVATIPATVGGVIQVAIAGAPAYSLAAGVTPQPGEFTLAGGTLTIVLREGHTPPAGSKARVIGQAAEYPQTALPTDEVIDPAEFFARWNLQGEVSFSREFEGHPSAQLTLLCLESDRESLRQAFRNNTRITLYGMGFEVAGFSTKPLPKKLYPEGWLEVSVELSGWWERPTQEAIKLAPYAGADVPLAELATAGGVTYRGVELAYSVERKLEADAAIAFEEVLEQQARLGEGYQFLSAAGAVEVREWSAPPTHYLAEADILEESGESYPGREFEVDGVQLVQAYENTPLALAKKDDDRKEYPRRRVIFDPNELVEMPPGEVTDLRSPGLAFDAGGPTKTRRRIELLGDTILSVQEVVYGFKFNSLAVYERILGLESIEGGPPTEVYKYVYDNPDPALYWQNVRSSEVLYEYDSQGFLLSIVENGWQLARFKTEGEERDLIEYDRELVDVEAQLQANPGNAALIAQRDQLEATIDLYNWFWTLPVNRATVNQLERFDVRFPDTPPEQLPDTPAPRYLEREEIVERSAILTADPESTAEKPRPPLQMGKNFYQLTTLLIRSAQRGLETFNEYQITRNQEGANFKNSLLLEESREVKGKPSPANQSTAFLDLKLPPGEVRSGPEPPEVKWLLNTVGSGYPEDGIQQGSASYETDDVEVARRAAEIDLVIANFDAEAIALVVRRNLRYQEGDRVVYRGKPYRVQSVSWSEVMGETVTCAGMELRLGRELPLEVTLARG